MHAVDDVNIGIEENATLGLVGESGSGKSTLGKMLTGLLRKTNGEILFRGEPLPDEFTAKDHLYYAKEIQMIFQDPYSSLNPRMTIGNAIMEPMQVHNILNSDEERKEKVKELLTKVSLDPSHFYRYPHEFSGGQRQRIGIARALAVNPKFIICDESVSALDVSVQAQFINLLDELKASLGLTLLFIAHDLSMVRYVSDYMAVMYLGSVIEYGPSDEVFYSPKHPYTRLLIESNPEPDPKLERSRDVIPIKGEITSPINIQSGCRFADRCPSVKPECRHITPVMTTIDSNHTVACHLYT